MINLPRPVLVLGYGNPSRGDDALAPLLLEHISRDCPDCVEVFTDFQLQIEHALDLKQRQLVLFVDASVTNNTPVELRALHAAHDTSYSTHAMSPAAVMQVYNEIEKSTPPPCFLLTLQGVAFELGAELSDTATHSLRQGVALVEHLLSQPSLTTWQAYCGA